MKVALVTRVSGREVVPYGGSVLPGEFLDKKNKIDMITEFNEAVMHGTTQTLRMYTWDDNFNIVLKPERPGDPNVERQYERRRGQLLDAYRRYQAAVCYGEFPKDDTVAIFVQYLYNRDWSVIHKVPEKLKYFLSE